MIFLHHIINLTHNFYYKSEIFLIINSNTIQNKYNYNNTLI